MSKLNELIVELCPNGVEYYQLGDLGKFYGGLVGKSKNDFIGGNAKLITYRNVYSNPAIKVDVDDTVKIGMEEKQRTLEYGDVIITGSSETLDECGLSSVLNIKTDEKLYLNSFCFIFRFDNPDIMLPDFSKHLFRSSNLRHQIRKTASGVTRFNISKKLMEKVVIPIPPLTVQCEIVRMLDTFTLLTTELTAELAARKKQYEFYRENLLFVNKNETIQVKCLGDFCDLLTGYPFDSSQFSETGVRLMRGMNIKRGVLDFSESINRYWLNVKGLEKYLLKKDDIVIAMDGSLVGKSYGSVKEEELPLLLVQRVTRVRTSEVNIRYIYHYIASGKFTDYVEKQKTKGAIPHISLKDIANFQITLPPLDVQEKIVFILDKFEAICNDPSIGLPAEIEVRKKQYEYYRDKLLSF